MIDNEEQENSSEQLDGLIAEFLRLFDSGDQPGRDAFLRQHSDYSEKLADFAAAENRLRALGFASQCTAPAGRRPPRKQCSPDNPVDEYRD